MNNVWQVRATAWELAAVSFRYPNAELAEAVTSGEWAEAAGEVLLHLAALRQVAPNQAAPKLAAPNRAADDPTGQPAMRAADVGALAGCPSSSDPADPASLLHALRAEATRLFVGAPEPVCSPYEGIWRATDDGVQALLFVNPHSMEVERFMKSCGLGHPSGTNEPLDHVSAECELLSHLALRAAGAEPAEGAPADADLPGGSPAAAYETFLEEHVQTWMPRFAASVAAEARHPFYRAAAAYVGTLVEA